LAQELSQRERKFERSSFATIKRGTLYFLAETGSIKKYLAVDIISGVA